MSKNTQTDIQRINQALSAAISSVNLAKNLLQDIESSFSNKIDTREIEGIVGVFDGQYLVTSGGVKYDVPVNYASKSKIVFGDTLKMIEDGDKKVFKQIERVKRTNKQGIISKHGQKMVVVTGDGTYDILQVALDFYGLSEGDEVEIIVPEENVQAPFAAIEKNLSPKDTKPEKKVAVEPKVVEKKPEIKHVEKVIEKPVEKKVEVKKVSIPTNPTKPVSQPSAVKAVSKGGINSIAEKEDKPKVVKTDKITADDNSISRIITDDDLR